MKNRFRQYGKMRGGTLLGIALGLLVGVLVSFGVVWYLNQTPLPFVDKVAKPEAKGNNGAGPVPLPGKPGDKPVEKPAERKFDFYDILEGKKQPAPGSPAPAVKPAESPASPPVAVAPSSSSGVLYLQVGAFQKAADAESLKGKLAMLGFEASVQEAEVPEKGLMRRVRVGPYADTDKMNQARIQLSQNGIPATVVRVKE
jgi:cell division protein FtsN